MVAEGPPSWLLLVVSLPTPSATARMRVWRALKALGCMALRDGAYLLPEGEGREDALLEIAEDCTREGGVAWLIGAQARGAEDEQAWRALFDRSADYAELRKAWKDANRGLSKLGPTELARLQRKLQREFDAVRAIDFFPADASVETEATLAELAKRIEALLSPDEPHEVDVRIPRLLKEQYVGQPWATRRRPWVDRVASAWLIRRFIDPQATFLWLAKPADCPKGALGFDFDGAAFTHVGDRVTFETLLACFDLEEDLALLRLATVVHHLDVGGEPVAEAAGFEAVMTGARERLDDDDALLAEISSVLDSLYAHFQRAPTERRPEPAPERTGDGRYRRGRGRP
jgi:hypothetical protein